MTLTEPTCRRAGATGGRSPVSPAPPEPDAGTVTAETAVVLPVLVALVLGFAWVLGVGVTKVRVVDAARETARAVARQESRAVAVQLGRQVAPAGSTITLRDVGETVEVTVTIRVRGPGGLLGFLPGIPVAGRAVAAKESASAGDPL